MLPGGPPVLGAQKMFGRAILRSYFSFWEEGPGDPNFNWLSGPGIFVKSLSGRPTDLLFSITSTRFVGEGGKASVPVVHFKADGRFLASPRVDGCISQILDSGSR